MRILVDELVGHVVERSGEQFVVARAPVGQFVSEPPASRAHQLVYLALTDLGEF